LDLLISRVQSGDLLKILRKFGSAREVGKSFTVIKWYPNGVDNAIDVALPSRRNIVFENGSVSDPDMPIEEDLAQRDFTVNAIALDLRSGELFDPFNGEEDLSERVLRQVNENSLSSDPLRCLRAAYFCAKCDLKPEKETLENIIREIENLGNTAPERIGEELKKLLMKLEKPSAALNLWNEWGVLKCVMPELVGCIGVTQEGGWHAHDVFDHLLRTVDEAPPILEVRLAALFHDIGKPKRRRYLKEENRATFYGHQNVGEKMTRNILDRLKFSNDDIDRVGKLVRFHMFTHAQTDKGVRRFVRRVGEELLSDLYELRFADIEAQGTNRDRTEDERYIIRVKEILDERPPLSVRDLAVTGSDIMTIFGIPESPEIGKILIHLLEFVLDDPSRNDREILIGEIRRIRN
jgi:putative nucleotidyltransferase with HDIG domain